ncbi:glycine cleavage system protein T [Ectothiorhodospira haloalkaliphila]|uniref:Glycine cleavage system protein T n=1 Tax=Ectothiorhodospira haloalkaliphila TaxID=421628 RepID=W8KK64_9GAMM|nr:folate-binding protein YgfZ [Ectothiorhodospira haloalkaliphila]AHK79548.1 glycine cleavage system protein T [Ectothiorhodospira haloalkaliphila]
MKPEWKDFLLQAGAEMDDQRVSDFGNPEREMSVAITGDVICDLSHHGLIGAYGEEAVQFLQGQFSTNVPDVNEHTSRLGAYCSPKGRMLASFRLFKRGETYYLRLPREQVESTLKRLSMFILRAKVTLEDAGDALVRVGVSGPHAVEQLQATLGKAPPEAVDQVIHERGVTVLRVPGLHPRFEVYGELDAMTRLWQNLNVRSAPVGADRWGLLDVMSGVPNVYPQTAEAFLPQMANLQLLGGVSFNKGCFPGQEVVARTQHLGKLKRRMYRLHLPVNEAPPPGATLHDASVDATQPVGRIVEAYPHPDGGIEALAVLQVASAEAGEPHLDSTDGPVARVQPLPYSFDLAAAT